MANKQLKHFAFTWNNYQEVDWESILKDAGPVLGISYIVYGFEIAPTTGTKHLQGYIQTEKRVYLTKINKCLPKVHITICNGSSQDNINYCKKLDNFFEAGTPRVESRRVKKCKDDWEALVNLAENGKLEDIRTDNPREFLVYYRTFKQIAMDKMKPEPVERYCYWIHGKPGTGKSRAVHQHYPDAYWKNANKWWDGYQGQETVVLDDLGGAFLYEHLKRWADRYPVIGEVKGSSIGLSYKRFIVTSNFDVDDPATTENTLLETIRAVQRRFVVLRAVEWDEADQDLIVELVITPSRQWRGPLRCLMFLHESEGLSHLYEG
jgi:hypothetical protein